MLGVGQAKYVVDQITVVGVVFFLEIPINAFAFSVDQVPDDPGQTVSVGQVRSPLLSLGHVGQ